MAFREIVFENVIQSMVVAIRGIDTLGLRSLKPELEVDAANLLDLDSGTTLTKRNEVDGSGTSEGQIMQSVAKLWRDPSVREVVLERANEVQLNDSAQ